MLKLSWWSSSSSKRGMPLRWVTVLLTCCSSCGNGHRHTLLNVTGDVLTKVIYRKQLLVLESHTVGTKSPLVPGPWCQHIVSTLSAQRP